MNVTAVGLMLAMLSSVDACVEVQVQNLGAGKFLERERAKASLTKIGLVALPRLMAHANDPNLEIARRSRELTEQFYMSLFAGLRAMPRIHYMPIVKEIVWRDIEQAYQECVAQAAKQTGVISAVQTSRAASYLLAKRLIQRGVPPETVKIVMRKAYYNEVNNWIFPESIVMPEPVNLKKFRNNPLFWRTCD